MGCIYVCVQFDTYKGWVESSLLLSILQFQNLT
jgi:hypothetical protein